MVGIGISLQSEDISSKKITKYKEIDIKSMALSNSFVQGTMNQELSNLEEAKMEVVPASIIIPPRVEVFDGLTLEELADKLDRNMGSGYIAGKGMFLANLCIETGVDPYLALSIMLHETGCRANCSRLTIYCNNVGGQKGSPGCNGGSYKSFSTLDEGITSFVNNLAKNYYAYGLTTIEQIGAKYAEGNTWPSKIHYYYNLIQNS